MNRNVYATFRKLYLPSIIYLRRYSPNLWYSLLHSRVTSVSVGRLQVPSAALHSDVFLWPSCESKRYLETRKWWWPLTTDQDTCTCTSCRWSLALMLLVNGWLPRIQTGCCCGGDIGHCFYSCLETSNPLYSGVHVIYHTWRDRLYFNDKKSGIIIWCGSIGEEKGDMESLETMGRGWRHIFTNIKSASSAAGCGVLRCIDGV